MKKRDLSKPWVTFLFWILWNTVRLLPLPVASALVSTLMGIFAGRLTRQPAIIDNFNKAFPELPPHENCRTARRAASHLGVIAAELCHIECFLGGVAKGILTHSGDDQLNLARSGPVIFVGSHLGNWEIVPIFYSERGIQTTSIYATFGNNLIDQTILVQRRKTGAKYVEKGKAVRALVRALESGESLAFLMDQRVRSGVCVKFFGRDMYMTNVPARFAIRFKCPVVPMDVERRPGRKYHVVFGTPIYPPALPGPEAEKQITQAIARQLEGSIRRSPATWFCNKKRWPNTK